jgi:hypothetical protein
MNKISIRIYWRQPVSDAVVRITRHFKSVKKHLLYTQFKSNLILSTKNGLATEQTNWKNM